MIFSLVSGVFGAIYLSSFVVMESQGLICCNERVARSLCACFDRLSYLTDRLRVQHTFAASLIISVSPHLQEKWLLGAAVFTSIQLAATRRKWIMNSILTCPIMEVDTSTLYARSSFSFSFWERNEGRPWEVWGETACLYAPTCLYVYICVCLFTFVW